MSAEARYATVGDREQFLQAAHYTNLQPLWAADNISKHAKYEAAE